MRDAGMGSAGSACRMRVWAPSCHAHLLSMIEMLHTNVPHDFLVGTRPLPIDPEAKMYSISSIR